MGLTRPVYIVQLISGSTVKHTFSSGGENKIRSLSVKPGMTTTIGSFELTVPDITGSLTVPGAFKDIKPFDDIKIWYGYEGQVSTHDNPDFAGKIETIVSNLDSNEGYTRTFIGSDYAECFTRVLANRGFINLSGDTIAQYLRNLCTGSTVGNLSSSNDYMAGDANTYTLVLNNEPVMSGIKEYADKASIDTMVTWNKYFRDFYRQENTGSETFVLGTNILDYSITRELKDIKNDIYVFGMRDDSEINGSDEPMNHDLYTETDIGLNWSAAVYSGSGTHGLVPTQSNLADTVASGSYNTLVSCNIGDEDCTVWAEVAIEPRMLTDGDFVHFYCYPDNVLDISLSSVKTSGSVILYTNADNFFVCQLEGANRKQSGIPFQASSATEYTINVGPNYEGVSETGSYGTQTGSYKWERIGNPDWFNITSVGFTQGIKPATAGLDNANMFIDGFYIGTKYQAHVSDSESIDKYGLRKHIVTSKDYISTYHCTLVANSILDAYKEPVVEVSLTTTGSQNLNLGYMYPMLFPTDNINEYMQLIDLEHTLDDSGFLSKCVFTNKKELRSVTPFRKYKQGFITPFEDSLWLVLRDAGIALKRWLPF